MTERYIRAIVLATGLVTGVVGGVAVDRTFFRSTPELSVPNLTIPQSREFIPGPNLDVILRDFAKDTINPDNSIFRSLGIGVKVVPMKGWTGEYKTLDGEVDAYIPSGTGSKELNLLFDMPGMVRVHGIPFSNFSEEEMLLFAQSLLKDKLEWNKNERELTNGEVVTDSISYHIEDEKSKKDFKIYRDGRVSLKVFYL